MKVEVLTVIKTFEIDETKATQEDYDKIIQFAEENDALIRISVGD
jgi:hypothetical protein